MRMRIPLALTLTAGALALGGCADDLYGYGGYGYGYGGYYAPYGYGYGYAPYYGYGAAYYDPFGWYGDYYYPGVGIFVYDSYRRPHRWDGDQERYWSWRRNNCHGRSGTSWHHEDWSRFNRSGTTTGTDTHWHHHG